MKKQTLGSLIRSLRTQNHMTQAALAHKLGVTDKAVSKWERDISFPDISLFPKLANLLGVTVDDLLNENTEEGCSSRLLQIFEMSHDIRTPLHIILVCVNMARNPREDEKLLLRSLESIRVSGEYLLQSIDHVMQVAGQEPRQGFSGMNPAEGKAGKYPVNVSQLGEYLDEQVTGLTGDPPGQELAGKRILVADDIMVNREIAAEILRQAGAEVNLAQDGRACVDMVESAPSDYYDLILMDIMMPRMDGLEATRRIRQLADPRKASIPIIAVSANVYENDRREALASGMNAFAEKPIFVDKLMKTIQQLL